MRIRAYGDIPTPVETEIKRRRLRRVAVAAAVLLAVFLFLSYRYSPNRPVVYSGAEDHFKYGSIGSDIENGLPLRIIKVLPRMFPEYLPEGAPRDLTAFGFIQEPGREMPIGFSQRRAVIDLVGLNCAACHVGVVRASEHAEPKIYLGMPANTVDLHAFFNFLFACAGDSRFTPDSVVAEVEKDGGLSFIDRYIYKNVVGRMQAAVLLRKAQLERFLAPPHSMFGPGRVDTFNPYKTNQFSEHYRNHQFSDEERFGTADFPSIWNQKIRHGLYLHWDGNNNSVRERNFSAAFGAGATPENVDSEAIFRLEPWLDSLPPPPYPFEKTADAGVLARGEQVYQQYCHDCHGVGGKYLGQTVPLSEIMTDEHRLNSYTPKVRELQIKFGREYEWGFKHFRKTDGYANAPLDGIWARAPYLHNGSVPTLYDLLTSAELRNGGRPSFNTGHGVYDTRDVGFRTDVGAVGGRKSFAFVIAERGNSNKGHTGPRYGTELSEDDKRALIEYLKTL